MKPISPAAVRALLMASAALFLLAPTLPALASCSQFGGPEWLGNTTIVFFGFMGPIIFEFGWYANVFGLLNASTLIRGRTPRIYMVVIQMVLTVSAFVPVPQLGPSESPAWICRWGPGFWMWFVSQSLVVVAAIAMRSGGADHEAKRPPVDDE